MLLGVPCVAADVGGIPSIFTGGEDGILYPGFGPGRSLEEVVRALSLAIMQMWEHTEEQARYSENAAKHARITHDKEKNYQKMLEIYAEIAGTSKR
jgi:glycosyltransferase involved in cell wall biosynthesis